MVTAGEGYAVTLTALDFAGWTLATVIPEAEFSARSRRPSGACLSAWSFS